MHPDLLEVAVQRLLRVSLLPEQAPRCQQGEPHPQPALVLLPAPALVLAPVLALVLALVLVLVQAQVPQPELEAEQAPSRGL